MDPNFMENEEKYKMLKKGRDICVYVQPLPMAFAYSLLLLTFI